jgi:prevent-host-death family protein
VLPLSGTVDARVPMWLHVAMKRVKIAELKDQLSRHLREVERGGEVEVTDRDRPIARIVPVTGDGHRVVVASPKRPFSSLRRKRYPPARWAVASSELLLEERQRR